MRRVMAIVLVTASTLSSPSPGASIPSPAREPQAICQAQRARRLWLSLRGGSGASSDLAAQRGGAARGASGAPQRSRVHCREEQRVKAREQRDRGDSLYQSGEFELAVEAYTSALEADCTVDGAFGGRAGALLMLSRYAAALHDAERAVHASTAERDASTGVGQGSEGSNADMREESMHAHLV